MDLSFNDFIHGRFDYDPETKTNTSLWLREPKMDIGGGRITRQDIDVLAEHPEEQVVTVSGLRQDTFEYFIEKYGRQLKAIRFFKNKFIEDLSPMADLPELEYVAFFLNQRVTKLWDMRGSRGLTGLSLEDFSRLHAIDPVHDAPALKYFNFGNAVWSTAQVESFLPLADTGVEELTFGGKAILDNDYSFLERMPSLRLFDFSLRLLPTEQVAWIVSNFPQLEGYALRAKMEWPDYSKETPAAFIVGKRKPLLTYRDNAARIERYVAAFEALKEKYRGMTFYEAFPPRE